MLKAHYIFENKEFVFDLTQQIDISLPLREGEQNPHCYYAENPIFETIRAEGFVGSVAQGGVCNYQKITFTPHGNGTHTECYGHISADGASVYACHTDTFALAYLVSVSPREQAGDKVIFWEDIEKAMTTTHNFEALIIRTLPNDLSKKTKNYDQTNPPYLATEVGDILAQKNCKHLLVDLPSVDREVDSGKLLTHRAFWLYPSKIRKNATITELVFVEDCISDGVYLLNLQTISLEADACPSKPLLYRLI